MRTLYQRIGGATVVAKVVDELHRRLATDPTVGHHVDPTRSDPDIATLLTHLDHALTEAGVTDERLRQSVTALVGRLWYARRL